MVGRPMLIVTVVCGLLAGCTKDAAIHISLYDHAPVPAVPDRTAAVAGSPNDGAYWAQNVTLKDGQLLFTLAQAFFGPACTAELGAQACTDDYGTTDEGHGHVTVAPSDLRIVTVVDADRQNYAITGAELATLVDGGKPDATAPVGFSYLDDPFLLTVTGGVVVEAREIWVP